MPKLRTVLGDVATDKMGVILPHEHICCYFEYFYQIFGKNYLDKEILASKASEHLAFLKEKYMLTGIVDCTPINLGRDLDVMKKVSQKTGIDIVCATGFYYTEEILLNIQADEYIYSKIMEDITLSNAGLIKFAIENEDINNYSARMLSILCEVQKATGLPLCIHTNGRNKNGYKVMDFVTNKGVLPSAVTIGHLSDSDELDYLLEIAKTGCFLGFDRLHNADGFCPRKAEQIYALCENGFSDQILLSHDALTYSAFQKDAKICDTNPYTAIFTDLLPALYDVGLSDEDISKFMKQNPLNMLTCFDR